MSDFTMDDLRELLDLPAVDGWLIQLDAFQEAPGTMALHDVLYTLKELLEADRQEGFEAAAQTLVDVCARWPEHPVTNPIQSLIEGKAIPRPRTLDAVLAERSGVPAHDDPVQALEQYLAKIDAVQHTLRHNLATARDRLLLVERTTSVLVTVLLILICLALIGWGGALGWWTLGVEPTEPVGGSLSAEP